MATKVFISKNESELQDFISGLASNIEVISHSFLTFESLYFEITQKYEIIFFSSIRSVIFFKTKYSIPSNVKIACVGKKTKLFLEEMNHKVLFSRRENQSMEDFVVSFKEWCGNKRVLFPISSISLKTISSKFPQEQIEEIEVYSTQIIGKKIEECDVYVFSSPSNVEGFLMKNTFPQQSKNISWGESTSKYIVNNGGRVDVELKNSSLAELRNVLMV